MRNVITLLVDDKSGRLEVVDLHSTGDERYQLSDREIVELLRIAANEYEESTGILEEDEIKYRITVDVKTDGDTETNWTDPTVGDLEVAQVLKELGGVMEESVL